MLRSFSLADQLEKLFRKNIGDFCPDANDLRLSFAVGDDPIFVLLLDNLRRAHALLQEFFALLAGTRTSQTPIDRAAFVASANPRFFRLSRKRTVASRPLSYSIHDQVRPFSSLARL